MKIEKISLNRIHLIVKSLITFWFCVIFFVMYLRDGQVSQWITFILGLIVGHWFKR
jgi:hypothetical protein